MKSDVYQGKVNKRDELLAHIKEHQEELRNVLNMAMRLLNQFFNCYIV